MAPKSLTILFLNENPLPPHFTRGTISGKELRLRSALPYVKTIHVICAKGFAVDAKNSQVGKLEQKIVLHHLPSFPHYLISLPLFIWGLYYALKLKPDTIEAESPIFSGPIAVLLGKMFNIPSIVEVRTTFNLMAHHRLKFLPLKFKKNLIDKFQLCILSYSSHIIVNSTTYHQWLMTHGLPSVEINPGLQYAPQTTTLPPKPPYILGFMGRLVPEKGLHLLIDAIDYLAQRGGTPKFKVEIAGDGPSKDVFVKQMKSKNLNHLISFLGQVNNFKTLSKWHLLINPCLVNAPLEMVNAEAAYMGIPVICFGDGLIPETVIDKQTGLHVKQKNAFKLSKAIQYLLKNPKLYHHLSQNARHLAHTKYSFSTQVTTLDRLYSQLIS